MGKREESSSALAGAAYKETIRSGSDFREAISDRDRNGAKWQATERPSADDDGSRLHRQMKASRGDVCQNILPRIVICHGIYWYMQYMCRTKDIHDA